MSVLVKPGALIALLAGCATAPPTPTTLANSATAPKQGQTGSSRAHYVGTKVGLELHESATPSHGRLQLPTGLARIGVVNTADSHLVITRRATDMILLVTDDNGIVTDDLTIPDVAESHVVVPGCTETAFLCLVAKAGCPTAQGSVAVMAAWDLSTRLAPVAPPAQCGCDLLHLGE
jgi:hypothetical protein